MTENAPPATASGDSSRGMPYYEKLRRDLRDTLQKKRALDAQIMTIEDNIYRLESQYLEDTTAGNIIKGFDNYIKGSTGTSSSTTMGGGGGGTSTRRKPGVTEADRIFSRSSASYQRDDSQATSSTSTPAVTPGSTFHAGANASGTATPNARKEGGGSRKKKEREDDEVEGKSTKRGKITYARE